MRTTLGLPTVLCSLFFLVSFGDSFAESKTESPTAGNILEKILGLDPDWRPTAASPFIEKKDYLDLKVNIGAARRIQFPRVLDATSPIMIHTRGESVKQYLVSKGTYKAELAGKYLVYRGKENSILYRYDPDRKSLREYVYLEQSSDLPNNGEVVQWRFEGADLELGKDGSIAFTRTENFMSEVRKVSTNAMADRISRFLAKRPGTPFKEGPVTQTLFAIPAPEYFDGNKTSHTAGVQYSVEDRKLTLLLQPESAPVFPLWIDPTLTADADSNVILNGQGEFDRFGATVASAGDFNGDGKDDVIVGIDDSLSLGSAYIFFGGQTGTINDPDTNADVVLNRQVINDNFGMAVASAGDFNGDGKDDVIVGASNGNLTPGPFVFSGTGRAYIFFGGRTGTINNPDANADVVLNGQAVGDFFGGSVASAGDFNGDGTDDVIVGAFGVSGGIFGPSQTGSAYIFFGGAAPVSPRNAGSADVELRAQTAFLGFGSLVASAGDFNGDDKDDVIVGLPLFDSNGLFDSGSALIYFGGVTGTIDDAETNADVELNGHEARDLFGISVASAGDFNGDGTDDVIVGARNGGVKTEVCGFGGCSLVGTDSAYIFFGSGTPASPVGANSADVVLNGERTGSFFGISVASAGDFNGDGKDDAIVGSNRDNSINFVTSGRAYIFFGGQTGTIDDPGINADLVLNGQSNGDNFGISVASAGDFDGGGLDDVIVGANFDDNNGLNNSGSAFIFFGEGSTADTTPPVITVLDETVEATGPLTPVALMATALDDTDGVIVPTPSPTGPFAVGVHTINWSATDNAGNTGTATQIVTVQDTTPPAVTAPPDISVTATGPLTSVDLDPGNVASANDLVDGFILPTPDNTGPFPPGQTTVNWTATDAHGNLGGATQTITVGYHFDGFISPLMSGRVYKVGRTIPLKFQISFADGTPVSDAVGMFQLFLLAGGDVTGDPLEVESTSSADTGNTFRFSDPIYIFNLNTDGITSGTYRLLVSLNDGSSHAIDIGFK